MNSRVLFLFILFPFLLLGQIVELVDINPTGDSNPDRLYATSDNKIFFRGDDGSGFNGTHVWDGNSITSFDTAVNRNDNPNYFTELSGNVYYHTYYLDGVNPTLGNELTRSNGTTDEALTAFPGTGAGTTTQDNFVTANGKLYFNINDGESTVQIWMFDPALTPSGTNPTKIENPQSPGFAVPNNLAAGILGNSEIIAMEGRWGDSTLYLLILDPSTNTYSRIENSSTVAPIVRLTTSDRNYIFSSGGKYYFEGDATNSDDELWVTDGTTSGTMQISDINTTGNSDPKYITEHLGNIFFSANNGTSEQLYIYNGSSTSLFETINPSGNASISNIFSDGSNLYFSATNGTDGEELWMYNGSTTSMLKDINSGVGLSSSPSNFIVLDGMVYFSADDGTGVKLWMTDGTNGGTISVASLFGGGEDPIDVDELIIRNSKLIFSGTGTNGNELFSFDPATLSTNNNDIEVIKVFPNPASDYIMLSKQLVNKAYSIHDISGKALKTGVINSEKIDLNLDSGLYLFKIKTDAGSISKKIIVK